MPELQNTSIRSEGQITPELLIKWFEEAFVALNTPEEVKQEMRHFLEMDACMWLCDYGEVSHLDDGKSDPDGNPIIKSERDTTISAVVDYVFDHLESWPGWIEDFPCAPIELSEKQYFALELGYRPDFDCRYATFCRHGVFYLYRSGEVLYKFYYARMAEDHWKMTSCYRTAKFQDTGILHETLSTGYWRTSLVDRKG